MNDRLVKYELNNKILNLILNDPEHQNTLSEEMIAALDLKIRESSLDNKVKVIIER